VIFHRELEVREGDSDTRGHNDQNHKHKEQNAVQSVRVVAPHGRVHVVQLNVDRTRERKEEVRKGRDKEGGKKEKDRLRCVQ
jgi:hypothetical protein